jgi:ABC-type glutathione transport system ATPase component
MHRGRIVERGSIDAILDCPNDEYTRALINAIPRLSRSTVLRLTSRPVFMPWPAGSGVSSSSSRGLRPQEGTERGEGALRVLLSEEVAALQRLTGYVARP